MPTLELAFHKIDHYDNVVLKSADPSTLQKLKRLDHLIKKAHPDVYSPVYIQDDYGQLRFRAFDYTYLIRHLARNDMVRLTFGIAVRDGKPGKRYANIVPSTFKLIKKAPKVDHGEFLALGSLDSVEDAGASPYDEESV
jgi:hypothetical protein